VECGLAVRKKRVLPVTTQKYLDKRKAELLARDPHALDNLNNPDLSSSTPSPGISISRKLDLLLMGMVLGAVVLFLYLEQGINLFAIFFEGLVDLVDPKIPTSLSNSEFPL